METRQVSHECQQVIRKIIKTRWDAKISRYYNHLDTKIEYSIFATENKLISHIEDNPIRQLIGFLAVVLVLVVLFFC